MAIGTTPIFSEISGSTAELTFRTRRNKAIEISHKQGPRPAARSEAQQLINKKYGFAVEVWRTSTPDKKTSWNEKGTSKNISGFNYLVYLVIHPARYNKAEYDISSYGE